MTIEVNDSLDFNTDYDNSTTSGDDGLVGTVHLIALMVLGVMIIKAVTTVWQCRNEIKLNWKWSRQQVPTTKDSIAHMVKSAFLAGSIQLEIGKWEYTLRSYEKQIQERSEAAATKKPTQRSYENLRSLTTDRVKEAARKVLETILTSQIQKGEILELGANELIYNGKSYLANLSPKMMQNQFIYSDKHTPKTTKNIRKHKNYRQIAITKISKHLKTGETYMNIVALSVLDTIPRNQLPLVAKELKSALKQGGRVIILSDLLFDQSPFSEKHSEGSKLVIPMIEGNILGAKVISIKILKERAQAFGSRFVKYLNDLLELPHLDRFNYLMASKNLCSLKISSILCALCAPDDYEMIDHRKSYINDLESVFSDDGDYKILENGYQSAKVEVDGAYYQQSSLGRNCSLINKITVDVSSEKFITYSYDSRVTKGKIVLISKIYAFVAEMIK